MRCKASFSGQISNLRAPLPVRLYRQNGAELEAFRARSWRSRRRNTNNIKDNISNSNKDEAGCCTYDQLYTAIISRLNETSGGPSADLALSRAYIEELEVSGLYIM